MKRKTPMHPVTRRMYEAVKLITRSDDMPSQGRVASAANVSAQTLNNWEERGPSAQGLLDFQQTHGINATWLTTGSGSQLIVAQQRGPHVAEPTARYSTWPLTPELVETLAALEAEERRRIENSIRGYLDLPPLRNAGKRSSA